MPQSSRYYEAPFRIHWLKQHCISLTKVFIIAPFISNASSKQELHNKLQVSTTDVIVNNTTNYAEHSNLVVVVMVVSREHIPYDLPASWPTSAGILDATRKHLRCDSPPSWL